MSDLRQRLAESLASTQGTWGQPTVQTWRMADATLAEFATWLRERAYVARLNRAGLEHETALAVVGAFDWAADNLAALIPEGSNGE